MFICNLGDLNKKKYFVKWIVEWNDEIIVYLNNQNQVKIKSSICPHFGGEIIFNSKMNELKCLWHDWRFCEETGKCKSYPISGKLNPYDFKVEPQSLKKYETKTSNKKIYAIRK
tara:strand:- start:2427 stop:2768 length:342 start_codon:yes stop_codon:yes gene_type:complete